MKKFLFYLAIGLALASCSKDKDCDCDNNGNNGTATPTVKTNQIILGGQNDFKKYNIPQHIPINYNKNLLNDDENCAIQNEPNSLNKGNEQLNSFYKKYEFVNIDGAPIPHDNYGTLLSDKEREEYTKHPLKFYSCQSKDFDNTSYGLIEKQRIVIFYNYDISNGWNGGYLGSAFQYTAKSFYVFPTDESYKEYVNLLKSMYIDEIEKYYFIDPNEKLPLILVGQLSDAPPFIPKTIEEKGNKPYPKSFSFYNSTYDISYINTLYQKKFLGKYRFEFYDKRFLAGAGRYVKEPLIVEVQNHGESFDRYYLVLGGKKGYYVSLEYQTIKLMPEQKAIVFYGGEVWGGFLTFSDIEPYNDFVALLKEVINNKEAQDYVFIKD